MTDFSVALANLKQGFKIKRSGWNGTTLYVKMANTVFIDGFLVDAFFTITNTSTGKCNTWVPSSADLVANDWETVY